MKKTVLATLVVSALFSAPAVADPAALFNWSGIYLGVHGGYDWGKSEPTTSITNSTSYFTKESGGSAGGRVGAQSQFGQFVLGVEGDLSALFADESVVCINPAYTCSKRPNSLLDVTAKFGWASDRALIYGKAGWGRETINASAAPTVGGFGVTQALNGFVWGGGLEYAIAQNVSVGVEYIHVNLGSHSAFSEPINGIIQVTGDDNIVRVFLNLKLAPPF